MKTFIQTLGGLMLVLAGVILIAYIWVPSDLLRNILLTDLAGIILIFIIDKY